MPELLLLSWHLTSSRRAARELAFSVNSIANPHVVLRRYQYLPCTRMEEDMSRIARIATWVSRVSRVE